MVKQFRFFLGMKWGIISDQVDLEREESYPEVSGLRLRPKSRAGTGTGWCRYQKQRAGRNRRGVAVVLLLAELANREHKTTKVEA